MISKVLNYATNRSISTSASSPTLPILDFFATSKARASFTLTHGAAGIPKNKVQAFRLPVAATHVQVGEDAYFRRSDAIGVADGVGGWCNISGANPAFYSSRLMHYASIEIARFEDVNDPCHLQYNGTSPLDIMQRSYDQTLEAAKRVSALGSSTACIALLRNDELRVANLGDCGISVIRDMSYIFQSVEQQHIFNCPFQLGSKTMDTPNDATLSTINVKKGDIIIMASDGLFDNLYDDSILEIVRKHALDSTRAATKEMANPVYNLQPEALADTLVNEAKNVSETRYNVSTPFSSRAISEGMVYEGGKRDDISVIVAVVNDCKDSSNRR